MTVPQPQAEGRPREVELSFWLWIATIVLGVLGIASSYSQIQQGRDQTIGQMLAKNPGMDPATVERFMTVGIIVAIAIGLLFRVLEIVFAFLMRGGRNWARIVLTVFGGITVAGGLIGLSSAGGLEMVLGLIEISLAIGAIVYMYLPVTSTWFQPRQPGF